MAGIHGLIHIIVGAIVVIISIILRDSLFVFVYVGIGFIIFGILKLLYNKIKNPKEKKHKHQPHQRATVHPNHHKRNIHHHRQNHPNNQQQMLQQVQNLNKHTNQVAACPYCSNTLKISDNFCSNCGAFLKNNRSDPNFYHRGHNQ